MAREDALVVEEFTKVVVSHLKDVLIALPALVPQTKEDEKLFRDGMRDISNLVYHLEHAENVRELGRYINIQKVASEFDLESIKTLNFRINNTARSSIVKLDEMIEHMKGD